MLTEKAMSCQGEGAIENQRRLAALMGRCEVGDDSTSAVDPLVHEMTLDAAVDLSGAPLRSVQPTRSDC